MSASRLPRYRAAIIGCGRIAGAYDAGNGLTPGMLPGHRGDILTHAGALAAHPDFSCVACVDSDQRRREAFAEFWQIPRHYPDIDSLLRAGEEPDLACVATPAAVHATQVRQLAMESPARAILCEKPLSLLPGDARRTRDFCFREGKVLRVNYLRRFAPGLQSLAADCHAGLYGRLRAVSGVYGGGIINNGCHMLDLVTWIAGPLSPLSVCGAVADRSAADPSVDAVLATRDGARVHLVPGDARDYTLFECRLIFGDACIDIEDSGFSVRIRRPGAGRFAGHRHPVPSRPVPTGLGRALCGVLDAVAEALDETSPALAGQEEQTLAVEELAILLAARGREQLPAAGTLP